MAKRAAVAAALSGLLLVAGCTGGAEDGGAASGEKAGTSSGQAVAAEMEGPTLAFGERHEFKDGVAIEVSEPKRFRPSSSATTGGEPDYVRFDVRLANGTDDKISTKDVAVMVESGEGQAGDVIDVKKGLPGPAAKWVGPDGSFTWALGFGVLDPKDVTVQVQVGMDREPVTIRG